MILKEIRFPTDPFSHQVLTKLYSLFCSTRLQLQRGWALATLEEDPLSSSGAHGPGAQVFFSWLWELAPPGHKSSWSVESLEGVLWTGPDPGPSLGRPAKSSGGRRLVGWRVCDRRSWSGTQCCLSVPDEKQDVLGPDTSLELIWQHLLCSEMQVGESLTWEICSLLGGHTETLLLQQCVGQEEALEWGQGPQGLGWGCRNAAAQMENTYWLDKMMGG